MSVCRRQLRPITAEHLCFPSALSLPLLPSSGSAGDYSEASSHTKINKQFQRSPGNFATLNKSLQSQLWLHFTLTSSLTVPSFQDQLETCAKRIKQKQSTRSNQLLRCSPSCDNTMRIGGNVGIWSTSPWANRLAPNAH